jgi:uncharacterized protein
MEVIYQIIGGLVLAIVLPQFIKVITEVSKTKRLEFSHLFIDGGMPSSHSSFVSALSTAMVIVEGITMLTLITLAFSSVIIRDSFGIRLEVGKQKKILERLDPEDARKEKLKREGHTILQVCAGILFGVILMFLVLNICN